jgi:hypothetical protein
MKFTVGTLTTNGSQTKDVASFMATEAEAEAGARAGTHSPVTR